MAWFIGQSTLVIVLAFGLGLVVGWLLWARRMRRLTVEIVAARIRAAEHAAARPSYERRTVDADVGPGGPHIPAPRIESADVADREGRDIDGLDDDDLDDDFTDPYDVVDDDLDTRFDPTFFTRLGHQRSTSDLLGLDRFRDLFTPTNGRAPRTPEPRRTEPESTSIRDIDDDPIRRLSVGDNADDTTLAAAGLAGDGAAVARGGKRADDGTARDVDGGTVPDVDDATPPTAAAPAPGTDDDLTGIDGIGPKAAAALAAAGIRTFDQLAAADGDTVAMALRASGVRLTSGVHAWPLAARRLVARRIAERAGDLETAGAAPHTDNGHDHNGHNQNGRDRFGHDPFETDANANDRRGGLLPKRRSPGTPARRSVPPDALDPDDLARIEGIGPKFAAALVASGIRTFGQLANADEMVLRKAIGGSRPNVAPSLPTWPTQARLLATGDEDGFAELTARLIAGRGLDDDLERIDGIGPQTSAALRAAGIRTFRALAASDGNRLRAAIENAGLRATPRMAGWAAQARLLADGDEDTFADRAGRMSAGDDEASA